MARNHSKPEREEQLKDLPRQDRVLHVVGVGASSGALHALRTLFSHMPAESGVAWVVVVHLSPEHESHLVELLQPSTRMPIQQVTKTVALEANRVYVIPPNANLESIDTHLRLSELEHRRAERAPIDHFLHTLATTHDGTAISVILTGNGSDGSLGLRHIKECGGLTIAQDPNEAEFDSMPRSAIATGMVDLVLPLHEMPSEILKFCATRPRLPAPGKDSLDEEGALALKQILEEMQLRTGQDFAVYRRVIVLGRIRKRMQLRHVDSLGAYLEILRMLPEEARALHNDLLVIVSEFFSDAEDVDRLSRHALPRLFNHKTGSQDRIRAWSVGCSTGEEAYSLAILMLEEAARRGVRPQMQVFASDFSDDVLRRAREGVYPQEIAASVSPERLERFFIREGGHFRVSREVRDIVIFASQNLFRDPPFSHLDLIVCRDLLNDLQPDVRHGVLNVFYYALESHGMLLVGPNDAVNETRLFAPVGAHDRLYRMSSGPRERITFPDAVQPFKRELQVGAPAPATALLGGIHDFAAIHRLALEAYVSPSVLVNAQNEIVHYSKFSGRYVRLPGGEPTQDVFRLVREPLCSQLKTAFEVVRRDGQPWKSELIDVPTEGGPRRVMLRIDTVPIPYIAGLLVVVFDEESVSHPSLAKASSAGGPDTPVAQSHEELLASNLRLRALLDDHRHEQEQLSSANVDISNAHDELSSLMGQLETSGEELQVVNTELRTLDLENRLRLGELAQISTDLQHLLESTGITTLFLNRELRIIRFTPQLAALFNIRHTDLGRPLSDLTHGLRHKSLAADCLRVLETQQPVEAEVLSVIGRWYLMRILPYRPSPSRVDGVVVTLIDITDRKSAEESVREADRRKDEFLAVLAHELRNPLAPISTGVEILKLAAGDRHTVEQVAATIERQTRQLVRLVDDLLEISRISGGRLRLQKSLVDLAEIIRDAVATVRPALELAGHELAISVPEEPITLDADPARLVQVLVNLLSNAVRYTPRRGQLCITAERQNDRAVIVVSDNGVGIPADSLGRIFEIFYQGSQPRFTHDSGLGIGLTLAQSLVEMHGGTISVESEGLDRGSRFTLELPISTAVPAAATKASADRSHVGQRVLIIDDNVDAAHTLGTLMRALGDNDVHVASSGVQGLEMAAALHPSLVLLDLMMPGMDGYEVARRIRRESWGKDLFLAAVTGWAQDEHRRRTKEAGFDRHLTKPVDRAVLEAVLNDLGPAPPAMA